ncbi:MAG: RimK/LysX family protein [Rhodothermales bacterium]
MREFEYDGTGPDIPVGWREWVALPDIGLKGLKAKVDTGARSSSLHAEDIETFEEEGRERVRFKAHDGHVCVADIHDKRTVTSSTGHSQDRYFIRTRMVIGSVTWLIDLSLSNRKRMKFGMLLGREAMQGRMTVHPAKSFLQGRPHIPPSEPSNPP